jgi:branched-chain amino acid aminotransferase
VSIRVWIDGEIFDETTARVSVFDRGFLYGDSVYEVTRTVAGHPLDLERHLDRLDRSAAAIAIPTIPRARVVDAVHATLAAARNPDSYVRVVITRGAGEIGLDPALADTPLLIVIARPLHLPAPTLYEQGVEVALVAIRRNARRSVDPAVKSGNYLNNILAVAEGKRARDAYESIMCNAEGRLVEGSTSNIFVVKGSKILTPSFDDGLLDGITRRRVLELATAAGIPAVEAHLHPDDLRGADEAFLTSSIRGALPVVRVDGAPIGDGRPGPITRRVLALYDEHLQRQARAPA